MKSSKKKIQLSTSFHTLSADKKLSLLMKIIWIISNLINNNLPPKINSDKKYNFVKRFNPKIDEDYWKKIISENIKTPSRIICDLFWKQIPWAQIKKEVGEINIFDTGCGNGFYALKLNEFAKKISSYKGIDFHARSNWDQLSKNHKYISLVQSSSSDISCKISENTNLFITQSAIEHFAYDLEFFHQIKDFIDKSKNNIIQIHLFPAPISLWLYLFHGVRQYNLRSILKIINIFKSSNSYFRVYKLGGQYSNKLHFKFFTRPKLPFLRGNKKESNSYYSKLKDYLLLDMEQKNVKNPSFYALVIHTNYSNVIFE